MVSFSDANDIPWIKFGKDEAKLEVMQPHLARQATRAGIGFTALSNGFAACEDPAALQAICDRLGPGTINVFVQRWLHRLPTPFGPEDHDAGYWWETSMRQVESPAPSSSMPRVMPVASSRH